MFLHHPTQSSDGIAVSHHRINTASVQGDCTVIELRVESWPSEEQRITGGPAVARWYLQAPTDGLDLSNGLQAAVLSAVLAHEAFAGATPLPDADGTVANAKVRRRVMLEAEREQRLQGTFTSGGRVFDLRRSANLSGAVLDAVIAQMLGEPFSQFWVLADNSSVFLTAAETIAAGRLAKSVITGLWQTGQGLRDQLAAIDDETGTLAEVAAVVWP